MAPSLLANTWPGVPEDEHGTDSRRRERSTARSKACTNLLKEVNSITAIVGLTATNKVIAGIVSPDLRVFENPEKAGNWLATRARISKGT